MKHPSLYLRRNERCSAGDASMKTLGQIASEAYATKYSTFSEAVNLLTAEENEQCWQAAAAAIVEECAKVIDEQARQAAEVASSVRDVMTINLYDTLSGELRAVAATLRSLKATPSDARMKSPQGDTVDQQAESSPDTKENQL